LAIQGSTTGNIHGDLVLGVYIRPHIVQDIVYTLMNTLFTAGYRQFLWKGFHLEAQLDAGKAWGPVFADQLFFYF
jgi:hypothetical protein